MSYKHLSLEERHYIELSMKNEKTLTKIADDLRRSQSTITREIKRNLGCRGYRHNQADGMAKGRHTAKYKATKMTAKIVEIINDYIYQDWSPEQIAGHLAKDGVTNKPAINISSPGAPSAPGFIDLRSGGSPHWIIKPVQIKTVTAKYSSMSLRKPLMRSSPR